MSNRGRGSNRSPADEETLWYKGLPFLIYGNTVEYGYLGSDFENAVNEGFRGEEAARSPIPDDVLQVESVDFLESENVKQHHTDEYDITEGPTPRLVVRRGQQFTIRMDFTRPYDSAKDDLRLVFLIGDNPLPGKGTLVQFALSDKDEKDQWGAKISQQSGKSLTVAVFTPPDCIVGKWRFKLHVLKFVDNKYTVFRYSHKDLIYLLFNPWSKEDAVYMEEEERLAAYVLQDSGRIYVGTHERWAGRPWSFGQFSGQVLDCSMYLLDATGLRWSWRGDPVHIARRLSALVNFNDDNGVIVGNWTSDYSGGKSPLSWTGSAPILEQYYREKRPVRFGQCWVFSGVLATVCRALGLPTRCVTNFESAHDQNKNAIIEYYYDEKYNFLGSPDSVWNFHVWNEAWMARPDLPDGYGGWQAFDSTPQETSDGVMCCGPCPVRAIKEGEVNLGYDAPFIFAEVNADKVYWLKQADGSFEPVHLGTAEIGKLISTHAVGEDEREDLTKWYKYPEGSPEERIAVTKAFRTVNKIIVEEPKNKDVEFQLTYDAKNTFVGDEFKVNLLMKNRSTKFPRTVDGILSVSTMYYTGVVSTEVKSLTLRDQELKPEQEKPLTVIVSPDIYLDKLEDCCMMSLFIMVKVKETQQIFTKKDNARLRKPHLDIKGPDTAKKDVEFKVEVSFKNPLDRTLTDCYLEVEGPGVTTAKTYPQGEVPPKATFTTTIKMKPWKLGKREIVAVFNSRQLEDINGSFVVTIQK